MNPNENCETPMRDEAQTTVYRRFGYPDGRSMTIGEMRAALDELTADGYPDDAPVTGSSFLSVCTQLPALTPAQLEAIAKLPPLTFQQFAGALVAAGASS